MASPLGTIYSRADALKRQLYDMLTNPRDAAAMLGGRIVESGQQAQALQEQTFADPNRPFRVTDPQAMARLTDMLMAGPMGFAPAGTISGATRNVIRSSADDLANQLNKLGFQATVQHSGSRAGPSSYVQVYDPQTGRMFTSPVRFSGHGKGPREAAGVIEVQDPATDIPKIVQDALQMRQQGPSEMFQRQAIVDDLIAGGMKTKQAYKEADKRIAGLLDEPAQSLDTLNPTGSIFTKYDPSTRATAEISPQLTTYDITANLSPDDFVTVYRGVPSGVKSINEGDFVTTNKQLAKDYAGEGAVISKKVRASELLDDVNEPMGAEYIYRPRAKK
jgi:hypothetical protein